MDGGGHQRGRLAAAGGVGGGRWLRGRAVGAGGRVRPLGADEAPAGGGLWWWAAEKDRSWLGHARVQGLGFVYART
ncbi:hypothetical protein GUJ93_ZPchr0009g1440 [Zizania palustris]|uniref:Uncharacterized protein n=1 Tax=Zizania palustris TaxID=103762 RepID=A0A8J5RYD2_ZIZPA|nr:hypothetical protein GUJ93_ZPchr0009g1440 [Zizania palustris]